MRAIALGATIGLFIFGYISTARAQAPQTTENGGSSLEETVSFIKQKIDSCSESGTANHTFVSASSRTKQSSKIENGAVFFTNKAISMVSEGSPPYRGQLAEVTSESYVEFKLADVEAKVVSKGTGVVLNCTNGNNCFRFRMGVTNIRMIQNFFDQAMVADGAVFKSNGIPSGNKAFISVCSEDAATRVARAFDHLIVLSGGKKPAF